MDYNAGWKNGYPNNTYNHNDYGDRVREIDFDPGKDFHVYGAQIDPEPGDPMHLAVTFLLDGRVRSVFRTRMIDINQTTRSIHIVIMHS